MDEEGTLLSELITRESLLQMAGSRSFGLGEAYFAGGAVTGLVEEDGGILGERGLAAYRREAQAEWERLPALQAGQEDPHAYGRTFRLTRIMEGIARQAGDFEAMMEPITDGRYEGPVRLVGRVGKLMRRLGRSDEFRQWVDRLRMTYKRKRNFIGLLDSMRTG